MCSWWLYNKDRERSEIISSKILSKQFREYLFCNEKDPIQNSELTENFAKFCHNSYTEIIKKQLDNNHGLYVVFDCMLPPCCRTFDERYGKHLRWDCTNQFNTGDSIDIAFIRHPDNHEIYLPLRPIFKIMQDIMKSLGKPYIVSFDRLVYNTRYWEEENAVLKFYIIQGK